MIVGWIVIVALTWVVGWMAGVCHGIDLERDRKW